MLIWGQSKGGLPNMHAVVENNKLHVEAKKRKTGILARVKREGRDNLAFYLLALPGVAALVLFAYMPMAGLYIVFERYTYQGGLFGSEFVGLDNFNFFFANMSNALRASRNTIVVNAFNIVLGTATAVAMAVMINEFSSKWFKKITQSMMIFPYFISWIVIGMISFSFFDEKDGLMNSLLHFFGGNPVSWYSNAGVWWPILIILMIWKSAGFSSIVYFASLTGFDPTFYEAAEIDGATRLQKILKITIPLLKPTIIIMFLLSIGGILHGDLGQILGLTNLNPLLLETTDNINTFVYRSAVQNGQFEAASAVQLYQSVFGFLLVVCSNWLVKKYDPEYSLF
jgi:putative aldouronate transport system permease protein